MKRLLGLAIATIALAVPSTASAGTYEVNACFGAAIGNGSWVPDVPSPYVTAYSACPGEGIVTRMSGASPTYPHPAGYGAFGRQTFTAPPGTAIVRLRARVLQGASNGWSSGVVDGNWNWIYGGSNRSTWDWTPIDIWTRTNQLVSLVSCGAGSCSRSGQYGFLKMQDVTVTIEDNVAPNVTLTGGSATTAGWHRGALTLSYSGSDASGIRTTQVTVDNQPRGGEPGSCRVWAIRQCDDASHTQSLGPSDFVKDGRHDVAVHVVDAAGNDAVAMKRVYTDNTAPGQPTSPEIVGGTGWRTQNNFAARWLNPRQSAAPIAGARYRICPSANAAGDTRRCVDGVSRADNVRNLEGLRVPAAGQWRIQLWLEDRAGNADPERSVVLNGLRFDQTPPSIAFDQSNSSDPMRVRVQGKDATSGISQAFIEARRAGEQSWRSLPTVIDARGFSALLDDEQLPKGRYELRARAVDRAGNEKTIDREKDGELAIRRLPLRLGTRLVVGKPTRVRARGSHGRHKYRTVLRVRPSARYGRTVPLRGRITTPGANPLADVGVQVWEQVKLPGASWRRIGQVRTTRTGKFRFRALRGPSRLLRFRYPGTATIRARSTIVDLRVRATSLMRASRSHVVNGEEIRFVGRLKGRQQGALGKLIHLQVSTRGRWSTFATPRADRGTGRWSFPYRFTATRGSVTYRFRALIPRENGFPYETGISRPVRVSVRGL